MMLFALLHKADAQSKASLEQYYYMGNSKPIVVMPIADYQLKNNWYLEGRYNYEALKTGSVYIGKTFSHEGTVSYSFSPLLGTVIGQFNGGSAGEDLEVIYKNLSVS